MRHHGLPPGGHLLWPLRRATSTISFSLVYDGQYQLVWIEIALLMVFVNDSSAIVTCEQAPKVYSPAAVTRVGHRASVFATKNRPTEPLRAHNADDTIF